MFKSNFECRREGERAFERNPYGRDRNPYSEYGSYDSRQHHRAWEDGFSSAEYRDQERKREEECRERRRAQRRHEEERRRQQEEEEYYRMMQEQEEEEQQEDGI
jgi:hypothetical protein